MAPGNLGAAVDLRSGAEAVCAPPPDTVGAGLHQQGHAQLCRMAHMHAQPRCACLQGPAAMHFHLLEALLQRCVAQAAQHRLPAFFANGVLALAELGTQHQPQPAGAPTVAAVALLTTPGERRLTFCPSDGSKGDKRSEPLQDTPATTVTHCASPACMVRMRRPPLAAPRAPH
jgi:hypothetical protein